jgi:hypothetical protein
MVSHHGWLAPLTAVQLRNRHQKSQVRLHESLRLYPKDG